MSGAGKDTPPRGWLRHWFMRPEIQDLGETLHEHSGDIAAIQGDLAGRPVAVTGELTGQATGTDKAILKAVCDALAAAGLIDSAVTTD